MARAIAEQYIGEGNYNMVTVSSYWSTFETIGGYQPDKNNQFKFNRGIFLESFKNREDNYPTNKWLIIDEINRADIDKAFGSLFSALTGDKITLSYRSRSNRNIIIRPQGEGEKFSVNDYEYIIPDEWRMIATMNTFDKDFTI